MAKVRSRFHSETQKKKKTTNKWQLFTCIFCYIEHKHNVHVGRIFPPEIVLGCRIDKMFLYFTNIIMMVLWPTVFATNSTEPLWITLLSWKTPSLFLLDLFTHSKNIQTPRDVFVCTCNMHAHIFWNGLIFSSISKNQSAFNVVSTTF